MKLSFTKVKKSLIVSLEGELDLHTAEEFKTKLITKINAGTKQLILDLGQVEFIDSSGLGAILSSYKKISSQGGLLTVVNVTPKVRRIFEVSGILRVINIYSSEKEALENIQGGRKNEK